LYSEIAMASD